MDTVVEEGLLTPCQGTFRYSNHRILEERDVAGLKDFLRGEKLKIVDVDSASIIL